MEENSNEILENQIIETTETTNVKDSNSFNVVDGAIIAGIAAAGYGIGKGIEKLVDLCKKKFGGKNKKGLFKKKDSEENEIGYDDSEESDEE